MLDWTAFLSAIALMLIIEGLLPFINPEGWRSVLIKITQMDSGKLRLFGLSSIVFGILLLNLAR